MGTTPNMGIPYPESTDAVANGATAMESLATTVDDKTGLIKIGTFIANGTSRALVCDNVFSSLYDSYRVIFRMNSTIQTNAFFYQYINTSGASVNVGYYGTVYGQDYASATTSFQGTLSAGSVQYLGYLPNSGGGASMLSGSIDIFGPLLSVATAVSGTQTGISSGAYFIGGQIMGQMTNSGQHRGLRFDNGGAGNLTGQVIIYGYRN
jgi:hypothetical protein